MLYKNKLQRKLTVFLNNSVPVVFYPGEVKDLQFVGLEKSYPGMIELVGEDKIRDMVKEEKEKLEQKKKEKETIIEVKQPEEGKELISEPVEYENEKHSEIKEMKSEDKEEKTETKKKNKKSKKILTD